MCLVEIPTPTPQVLHSREVLIDFEPSEEEWAKLFADAKAFPKCNGQCVNMNRHGATRYSGNHGKCIYCGFEAKK